MFRFGVWLATSSLNLKLANKTKADDSPTRNPNHYKSPPPLNPNRKNDKSGFLTRALYHPPASAKLIVIIQGSNSSSLQVTLGGSTKQRRLKDSIEVIA
jgi:hypothetical protein